MTELNRFLINVKLLIIVLFYAESEENGKSPFWRKRQGKTNYCPFDRKLHPNEEIEIGAHGPGKGRRNAIPAQEDENITKYSRYGESL